MLNYFLTVVSQVITLFLLMAVGYVLGRMGRIDREGCAQFTFLLLYIVTPCVIVDTMQVHLEDSLLRELGLALFLMIGLYLCYSLFAIPLARTAPLDTRAPLQFGAIYGNVGFMGLPLAEAVLGSEARIYAVLTMVVFNVYSWIHGVLLMGGRKALSPVRAVLNPGTVSLVLGLPCLLFGLRLPGSIQTAVGFVADLNTPLAMVVIGAQMSAVDLPATLRQLRLYTASAMRLVVLPFFTALVLLPFHLSTLLYCTMVILSGAPSAGSTSMFAQRFGRDTATAAQLVSLSTVLSILTLPLMAVLAQQLSALG
ncbi:MAG TPA: AEC family transporter [Candidatus Flavonifractor merdigallinarum]|uniref:AEC family transporter n=1 Tax=Candidatus Flavonifractor merdigallinarum TaxID=2838589 RepID=A0A9D2C0C0_9FIRM|nr:AEC family transporter [Candidatus Flavonifractor merdigallinarum]